MANIEERPRKDGSTAYLVRWVDKKTRKRKTQRFDDAKDAQLMLGVLEAHGLDTTKALESTRAHLAGAYTVSKMVEDHIDLRTNANGYTILRYRGQLTNHLAPTIGRMNVAEVDYRDVVGWVKAMADAGSAPKTIANVHGLLSAAFKTAVRDRKRIDNPCAGVSLPRSSATEDTMSFLTNDEWSLLQDHIPEYHRPLFAFLAVTGARFWEATALYGRDFTSDRTGQVTVRIARAWTRTETNQPVIGPPKTRKSRRTATVEEGTAASMAELIRVSRETGRHLFLSPAGLPVDHRRAWEVWDEAVKSARALGLDKKPRIHDLRHSNASWLLQAGLDIYKLQLHLGHESITTTIDRYSHLLPEGVSEMAAVMNRAFV
ncbi:tyrosine-type recombinase/integrase [Arthrobacter sp. TMT4-20]